MSLWYKFLYRFNITPWEEDPAEGTVAEQISKLFKREENTQVPPYGPALDLGCGSGIWSVELAKRGWEVTGIDIVSKAIGKARERANAAGVNVQFVEGDVTRLRDAGVGSGFRFVVDFECFNHLTDEQRVAVGRELNAITVPNAIMLMLVWEPGQRWMLPPGAGPDDIESSFPGWKIIDEDSYAAQSALPWWLQNTDLRFYRLRRD